jgi:hypothetical protein
MILPASTTVPASGSEKSLPRRGKSKEAGRELPSLPLPNPGGALTAGTAVPVSDPVVPRDILAQET